MLLKDETQALSFDVHEKSPFRSFIHQIFRDLVKDIVKDRNPEKYVSHTTPTPSPAWYTMGLVYHGLIPWA